MNASIHLLAVMKKDANMHPVEGLHAKISEGFLECFLGDKLIGKYKSDQKDGTNPFTYKGGWIKRSFSGFFSSKKGENTIQIEGATSPSKSVDGRLARKLCNIIQKLSENRKGKPRMVDGGIDLNPRDLAPVLVVDKHLNNELINDFE